MKKIVTFKHEKEIIEELIKNGRKEGKLSLGDAVILIMYNQGIIYDKLNKLLDK